MSLDERLFGRLHRTVVRTLRAARRRRADLRDGERAATLDVLAPRLRVFACALTAMDVELVGCDEAGGVSGRRMLLPRRLTIAPTAEENARLYRLRVAYAAASSRLGFVVPTDVAPDVAALYTLLAVPATLAHCARELPATMTLHADLTRHVLARRPAFASLPAADAALEALAQLQLGRLPSDFGPRVPPAVLAWAEAAAAERPADLRALRAAAERVVGRFGRGRLAPVAPWGTLLPPTVDAGRSVLTAATEPDVSGRERESPHRPNELRLVDLRTSEIEENPAVHSFEKVHTAEEYRGGRKHVDGEDELAEHADALDELDLREVVRSSTPTRSLYRADLALDAGVGDLDGDLPAVDAIPYDEWDGRRRCYRPAWCCLRASRLGERRSAAEAARWRGATVARHRSQIRDLRIAFARLEDARAWHDRQSDGPEIDLDAVVQRHATLRSGHAPSDRLYVARRRRAQDAAVLVLLDVSLSTDAWIDGRRVLDVARDSVLILGEALAATPIGFAIAAFASHTRRDCRFLAVKSFSETWDAAAGRLASLEPAGYTRIGPAVRHGAAILAGTRARRRLLVLVSDGKPTDYDRYEGRYGIADVRQAVREAEQRSLHVFALAVDRAARSPLPRMFGSGGFAILPRPELLARTLARSVAQLCH